MLLARTAYAPLRIFSVLIAVAVVAAFGASAHALDADGAHETGATDFVPGSFDMGNPPASFVDYSAPTVPTYNLSAPRRTESGSQESAVRDPATQKLRQEETLGRAQTKDGSVGLETDRRGDASKVVPLNDFSTGQTRKPDSFIGFSIVKPYDSK